ncbi:two-component system NarL family sensor kinase [Williamsia limnetica]|uniref:histidine kinase n=1 Tax=Williamsia limnetica TaxID=882452 RepID=A0A318S675_WILLI|nr:ATP-binding protein [Williamsia limnetica]PYE19941.1 two-component system NarL family sensor kinase [Williamsia limnetica]
MTGPQSSADASLVRITAALRLLLVVLFGLLGVAIPDGEVSSPGYYVILAVYALIAVGWFAVVYRRQAPPRIQIASPAIDVLGLIGLAAFSGGATSMLQPAFFLIPIAVAFKGAPWATGLIGGVTSVAYLVVWLTDPGAADVDKNVTWLNFGFLLWLTAATTGLSYVLLRRSRRIDSLLTAQRQLVTQTLAVADRERAVLAEALHDRPLQTLLATRMDLEDAMDSPSAESLAPVMANLRSTATELRELVSGLHPQVLAQLGLAPALEELARRFEDRSGVAVRLELAPVDVGEFSGLLHTAAGELLTNVAKHAHATEVTLELGGDDTSVLLVVTDNGVGFDPSIVPDRIAQGHIGIGAQAARVIGAGGTFTISEPTGGGTRIAITVPR